MSENAEKLDGTHKRVFRIVGNTQSSSDTMKDARVVYFNYCLAPYTAGRIDPSQQYMLSNRQKVQYSVVQ